LPQVKATVEEGKQLYELIEENIEIETVGLLPLYRDAGYLLLRGSNAHQVKAYSYQITMFESANERYRGMHSQFVADFTLSIGTTYESINGNSSANSVTCPILLRFLCVPSCSFRRKPPWYPSPNGNLYGFSLNSRIDPSDRNSVTFVAFRQDS
jgi:hypothetical protein